ncbi:MAG TPA: glycosyltransferase [Chitinispirillaceae bacterium]|nr:glycosyltransferase [Chitinispirillaceae bacterium]
MKSEILISVVIVNYKVPECLLDALRSLREADLYEKIEIIVVDNASNDNSQQLISTEFSNVNWIQLKYNVGFGKASNIGVKNAHGKYVLLLNPDTVIANNTLSVTLKFMNEHPDAGLIGPKILNPDGTLQASCRRSFVTPSVAFYHFSGLSQLFPKSRRFGRYNLTYMDPNVAAQVDAVSGSFMFLSKKLFVEIGGFDEQFFLYGEDLDLCWRIRKKGYEIWYNPDAQMVHRKGRSSAKNIFRSQIAFYEAMILFFDKYRHTHGCFFPGWLIIIGIMFQAAITIIKKMVNHFLAVFIDLAIINISVYVSFILRFFNSNNPYQGNAVLSVYGIHFLLSFCFIFMFSYNGIYSKKRYSITNVFSSGLLASLLFFSSVYFVKSLAFSRIAFAVSSAVIPFLLVGWRGVVSTMKGLQQLIYTPDKILIIGTDRVASTVIRDVEEKKTGKIVGVLSCEKKPEAGEFEGYPILGDLNEIKKVFKTNKIDMILIATNVPWYSNVIEVLSTEKVKDITIRWVPHEFFEKAPEEIEGVISLQDFSI